MAALNFQQVCDSVEDPVVDAHVCVCMCMGICMVI